MEIKYMNLIKGPRLTEKQVENKYFYVCIPESQFPEKVKRAISIEQAKIPTEDLYVEEADTGLELDYHITVMFGLLYDQSFISILSILENYPELSTIDITFGIVSAFRRPDKPYDVLKIEIISPKLKTLHQLIKDFNSNEETFDEYNPHLTLAYINKGTCLELEGPFSLTGKSITIDTVQWDHVSGRKFPIPLSPSATIKE